MDSYILQPNKLMYVRYCQYRLQGFKNIITNPVYLLCQLF